MTTLAVLGGGQLGRMLALAAIPLGIDVKSLDPVAGAPAGAVSTLTVGALDDPAALRAVAADAFVVTYEWEGVPAGPVRALAAAGAIVRPTPDALEVTQDRLREKQWFTELGIPIAEYAVVTDRTGLDAAIEAVGSPAILKTARGGYDGKGQFPIDGPHDADTAWETVGAGAPLVLERRVAFDRELSILAVRSVDGDVRAWPLVENEHRDGILRVSRAPAHDVTVAQQTIAEDYARTLMERWDYVGVLAIELFDAGGELLANEMAPRVHNSGHWTIEGATTSQFENHVRAVLGWPLGDTTAPGPCAMVNCVGALPDPTALLAVPGAHLHRYGKLLRPGRKVGHVTVTAADAGELARRLARVLEITPADG